MTLFLTRIILKLFGERIEEAMVLGSRRRVGLEGVTSQGEGEGEGEGLEGVTSQGEVGSSSGLEGVTSQGEVGSPAGAGVPRAGWIKDDDVGDDDEDGVPRAGWIKDDDVGDDDERTSCLQMIPWLSHLSSISSN